MPYIKKEDRARIDSEYLPPRTPGEVNYAITKIIDQYLFTTTINYTNINAMIGVLECAKLELYRRIAAPYEDKKIKENGDVYESW